METLSSKKKMDNILFQTKLKLIDLIYQNNKRLMIDIGVYGNFGRAICRTKLSKSLEIKIGLRRLRLCTLEEFKKAERELLKQGIIQKFKINYSKTILILTNEGIKKYLVLSNGKKTCEREIEEFLKIDIFSKNRTKIYNKVMKERLER